MSAVLSYFVVKGVSREAALAEAGLEVAEDGRSRTGVADLDGGWLLFTFNRNHGGAFTENMIQLSRHGPAVACVVDERVGHSGARGYQGGRETWRVERPNIADDFELIVTGTPPPQFAAMYEAAKRAQQAEMDGVESDEILPFVPDVPFELVRSVCGYAYDVPVSFTAVRPIKRGFLQRLFGKR